MPHTIKNILVLTNIYPAIDLEKENTPVVHYFTREWIKMGYEIRVIHYPANFPKILMKGASIFKKQLSSKLGVTIRTSQAKELEYKIDNVKVKRIPLLKYKLHGSFSQKQIERAYNKTIQYLNKEDFKPDFIISHWVNPQIEIMNKLKSLFNVKTCYIAHTPTAEFERIYNDSDAKKLINNIDIIGFRSRNIKELFCRKYNYHGHTFQCYSGIPEKYIPQEKIVRDFNTINKFIFVGTLIKRKYPAEILLSLSKSYKDNDFEMSYIGKGAELEIIKKYSQKFKIENKVHLYNYVPRDKVVEYLKNHDVFIMISKNEAFGLVYLEAMAQGCITIASKNEGFDGIIQHGVNGFLCKAGDVDELANIITEIKNMDKTSLKQISQNAIETAKNLTDFKAASYYINEIERIK